MLVFWIRRIYFIHLDYNNICLGKRIFGPTRKQIFKSTIIGGVERRFEIIENQVNHIPFTHEASDKSLEKCRNPRKLYLFLNFQLFSF